VIESSFHFAGYSTSLMEDLPSIYLWISAVTAIELISPVYQRLSAIKLLIDKPDTEAIKSN